jgi:hypothetical protein
VIEESGGIQLKSAGNWGGSVHFIASGTQFGGSESERKVIPRFQTK